MRLYFVEGPDLRLQSAIYTSLLNRHRMRAPEPGCPRGAGKDPHLSVVSRVRHVECGDLAGAEMADMPADEFQPCPVAPTTPRLNRTPIQGPHRLSGPISGGSQDPCHFGPPDRSELRRMVGSRRLRTSSADRSLGDRRIPATSDRLVSAVRRGQLARGQRTDTPPDEFQPCPVAPTTPPCLNQQPYGTRPSSDRHGPDP